jgi:hypothetical protein
MSRQFACRYAEVAEPARDRSAIVVAGQKERRAPGGIIFENRRNIFGIPE